MVLGVGGQTLVEVLLQDLARLFPLAPFLFDVVYHSLFIVLVLLPDSVAAQDYEIVIFA